MRAEVSHTFLMFHVPRIRQKQNWQRALRFYSSNEEQNIFQVFVLNMKDWRYLNYNYCMCKILLQKVFCFMSTNSIVHFAARFCSYRRTNLGPMWFHPNGSQFWFGFEPSYSKTNTGVKLDCPPKRRKSKSIF